MGHHIFVRSEGGTTLAIGDLDLELIKHLLMEAATEAEEIELGRCISRWTCHGPGVWIIDEKPVIGRSDIFDRAAEIVVRNGDTIPIEYLNQRLPWRGGRWTKAQAD